MYSWWSGKPSGLAIRETWVHSVAGCASLGKLLTFSDPQSLYDDL